MEDNQDQLSGNRHLRFMAQLTVKISEFLNNLNIGIVKSLQETQKQELDPGSQQAGISNEKCLPNLADYRLARAKGQRLKIDVQEERPKGPTSSFLIFYHDKKREIAQRYGSANVSRLSKLASQVWKKLPKEERDKYDRLSQESKVRYQKQMEQYKQKYARQIEKALKKRRLYYRTNWMRKKQLREALQKGQILPEFSSQPYPRPVQRERSESQASKEA